MQLKRNPVFIYFLKKIRLNDSESYIRSSIENLKDGVDISGPKLWVLASAIFIASLGLNINSISVIIGAMLISPLMGPVIGLGLGLGTSDMRLVFKAIRNYLVAVLISVATSTIYFLISPVKAAGSELIAITSPSIYDVLIAFFGGTAGIIASSSKLSRSNVIPGVAIATGLMPPLCTVGYGIANVESSYVTSAAYMFFINTVFICLSTYIVVKLLKYPHYRTDETRHSKKIKIAIWTIVSLTLIPSIYLTFQIVKKYVFETSASTFITNEISKDRHHFVIARTINYNNGKPKIKLMMLGEDIDSVYKQSLVEKLKKYRIANAELILISADEQQNMDQGIFENINNGVDVNSGSIQDLYARLDSLQKALGKTSNRDTSFQNFAREAKAQISALNSFSVTPSISYNYSKNNYDTSWVITVSFDTFPSTSRLKTFRGWLTDRLHTTNYRLLINK